MVPDYRLSEVLEDIQEAPSSSPAGHPEFRDNCSALLSYDLRFLNYARDPQILDMVEQLIEARHRALEHELLRQAALNGKKTPMHQDGEYWPIVPLATCTVWIAIDEATVENAVPALYPGLPQAAPADGARGEKRAELHAQPRARAHRVRREYGRGPDPAGGRDGLPRRLHRARLRREPLTRAAA